jgi:phospholipase/lecithinase/hemolysin
MIDRIVIIGDSMSDIGIKKSTIMGTVARSIGAMRVNSVGRFSDTKNWTDFLWEWSGGDSLIDGKDKKQSNALSAKHMSLKESTHGSPGDNSLSYVNYAVGGALASKSEQLKNKIGLTTIEEQKKSYFKELDSATFKPQNTLHIVWIGLNDTVTDAKDPALMKSIVAQVKNMTDEIRTRVSENGGKSYFMVVNNPDPQEAIRYAKTQDDPTVLKAQEATLEFNKYLKEAFPNQHNDTMVVDIYEALKTNLYKLRIIKAAQRHGRKVEFEKPENALDTSLANTLKEFEPIFKDTKEGQELFAEIQPLLNKALKTDNEIVLHKEVGDLIIKKIKDGGASSEKLASIKAIKNALMATGTYPSQIDFIAKYYQEIKPEKHKEDIAKLRVELDKVFSNKLPKQLEDNLNVSNTALYDTVASMLRENKDTTLMGINIRNDHSTFRELLDTVTASNLGFIATSDGAHPTQAAHKVIALAIAANLIQGFSVSLGDNFVQKAQNAFVDVETSQEADISLTPLKAPQDLSKLTAASLELNVKALAPKPPKQNPKGIGQEKPKVTFEAKPKRSERLI